jgi:hypothetical protein
MNIFYLDHDPDTCAQYHVDKHVIKMVLEYAQILSTCHRLHKSNVADKVYKATHIHHPSVVWASRTSGNYNWLYQLFKATNTEYGYRYGKWHASYLLLSTLLGKSPCPKGKFTEPTPAMDDKFKVAGDSIASYRKYYDEAKRYLHEWSNRPVPSFITGTVQAAA